jgi:Plasmid pRiA4b ORF-3-like protein
MRGPQSACQLKVTLRGTRPPVWRRLLVRADTTLFRLHGILQVAMGWTDTHLHQFHAEGLRFGVVDREMDRGMMSDRGVVLFQVIPRVGSRIVYEYDFGDGWMHDIRVEKIPDGDVVTPTCVDGSMACPPEDCGGVHGYAELLDAIGNPGHSRHDELMEWLGRPFDPAAFDCDSVNTVLARRRPRQRAARRGTRRSHFARSTDSN